MARRRDSTPYSAEFTYNGDPVGTFLGSVQPAEDGVFDYEPFRGLGHYEMWQEIEKHGFAKCAHELNGRRCTFEARDAGQYGKLALSGFAT
jgi:hypothetical protein